ncbi:Rieske 2Fe-2S domain-containing protein, partial [Brenneria populi]|nr:Rieske 2Fe-2S domain-containing protein [Brenneria populi Li et al. 2015]
MSSFIALDTLAQNVVKDIPQLPIGVYCDPAIYAEEQELIFRRSSLYIGHEQMVPNVGDWYALPHDNHSRVLVRNENEVALISNVCRHRQALMLGDFNVNAPQHDIHRGNLCATGNRIMCPLHAWTYDIHGQIIGAPKFRDKPCRSLQRFPIFNVSGFLFEGARDPNHDIGALLLRPEINFSDYVLDHVELHNCKCNW